MKKLIIFIWLISLFSCKEENQNEISNIFEVTSAGKGIDCGLIVIDFALTDKARIEKLTGGNKGLRFFAFNLDTKYQKIGQILTITARKTRDDELFACTTQGPSYPWVTILTASEK